jgi:hypothetical protein
VRLAFAPACSPESDGIAEASAQTLKRGHARLALLPGARIILGRVPGWTEDYDTRHPHLALRMLAPQNSATAAPPRRSGRPSAGWL